MLTQAAGMCFGCLGRLERTIRQLPGDVDMLTEMIGTEGSTALEDKISFSRELSILIRPEVEAVRAEIDFELVFWAEVLGMETPVGCRLPARVTRSAQWIAIRSPLLLQSGMQDRTTWVDGEPLRDVWGYREVESMTGLEGALLLVKLHHHVRDVAGRTKLVHRLTPACAHCGHTALVRHDGSDHVECEHCENGFDEKHYDWFCQVTLQVKEAA